MGKRIQIAFDLDTHKLKESYVKETGKAYTSAYKDIEKYMTAKGYEHRQGSVYHSMGKKERLRVIRDIRDFQKEHTWFRECVNKLDYGELNDVHDLLPAVKNVLLTEKEGHMGKGLLEEGDRNLQNLFREYNKKQRTARPKHREMER